MVKKRVQALVQSQGAIPIPISKIMWFVIKSAEDGEEDPRGEMDPCFMIIRQDVAIHLPRDDKGFSRKKSDASNEM